MYIISSQFYSSGQLALTFLHDVAEIHLRYFKISFFY